MIWYIHSMTLYHIKDVYDVVITGRGGQKIRELEEKSSARIKVISV